MFMGRKAARFYLKGTFMKKTHTFKYMHLTPEGLEDLDDYLTRPGGIFDAPHLSKFHLVYPDHSHCEFERFEDFLTEYQPLFYARYERRRPGFEMTIVNFADFHHLYSTFTVAAQDQSTIDDIFYIIDQYHPISVFFPQHPKESAKNLFASRQQQRASAHK